MAFAKYVLPFLLFVLASYFLMWGLGNQSLAPWDEAWYATIARNITRSGDLLHLSFNDQPYYDHPPLGFYAIATSLRFWGLNEFTARLPMAILGSLAIVAVFFTGKKLGGTWVGIAAGLILLSSRWFIIRSRSANLEAPLLFWQILMVYFFTEPTATWQLLAGWLSLSLALLTKSAISLTLLPLALWSSWIFLRRHGQRLKVCTLALVVFILPLLPWYSANYLRYGPDFIRQSIFNIGFRQGTTSGVTWETTQRTLLYLRSATHKWYLPLLASLGLGLIFIRQPSTRWTLAYFLLSAFPYLLSSQTQIWHLLPILPPAALLISLVTHRLPLPKPLLAAGFLTVFSISYFSYWPQFINLPRYTTFEAQVGLATKKNGLSIVSQETTYIPTLVWYADSPVKVSPQEYDLTDYPRPFQLVTHTWLLNPKLNARVTSQLGDTVVAVVD